MTEVREQYLDAWRVVVDLAHRVPPERWDSPTPCAGWSARMLVGHLVDGADQVRAMLTGQAAPVPITDQVGLTRLAGPTPEVALGAAAHAIAGAALDVQDGIAVQTPRGQLPLPQLLGMALIEPVTHGWDLAAATGQRVAFADGAVAGLLTEVEQVGGQLAATGMYAPATVAPDDAGMLDRLAAALGRIVG